MVKGANKLENDTINQAKICTCLQNCVNKNTFTGKNRRVYSHNWVGRKVLEI